MLPSKIERQKCDDDYITVSMDFFNPKVNNLAMNDTSVQIMFAILNITTSFWLIQNCGIIYKTNTAYIRTCSTRNFSKNNNTNICANSKIPSSHSSVINDSANKKTSLFLFSDSASADETKQFCVSS